VTSRIRLVAVFRDPFDYSDVIADESESGSIFSEGGAVDAVTGRALRLYTAKTELWLDCCIEQPVRPLGYSLKVSAKARCIWMSLRSS